MPCDNTVRDWSDAATGQGIPRTDSHHQKLGRGKEEFSPTDLAGTWTCYHPDIGLLSSRVERE